MGVLTWVTFFILGITFILGDADVTFLGGEERNTWKKKQDVSERRNTNDARNKTFAGRL